MGALPWADNSKCHLNVCLRVMFYVPEQTQVLVHVQTSNTHLHSRAQKSNTHRQLYLFFQSPWKCTIDQTKTKWTAYAFSTFLLPEQSNNIRSWWCSRVRPGPRSLRWVHSWGGVLGGEGGRGGEWWTCGRLDEIWFQIHKPLWLHHNTFIIESDKELCHLKCCKCAVDNQWPRRTGSRLFFTVQREAGGACDEIHADAGKKKIKAT